MIFDIQHCSFVDGPGIRTTVFFKGCNLRCRWCHNPEGQSFEPQLLFYQDRCIGCGKCYEKCPNKLTKCTLCHMCERYCPAEARQICGKTYTVDEVLDEIVADRVFYETSGGGATFSGGECMLQMNFLIGILEKCKQNHIHTAVDTAGHVPFEHFERIIPYTGMFLYDMKFMDARKHQQYIGVDNTLILDNLARLLKKGTRIWVRIPIIAGVNDCEAEILAVYAFFEKHGFPEKIELLPYNKMGENKYRAMGKKPETFEAPTKEKLSQLNTLLHF